MELNRAICVGSPRRGKPLYCLDQGDSIVTFVFSYSYCSGQYRLLLLPRLSMRILCALNLHRWHASHSSTWMPHSFTPRVPHAVGQASRRRSPAIRKRLSGHHIGLFLLVFAGSLLACWGSLTEKAMGDGRERCWEPPVTHFSMSGCPDDDAHCGR